MKKYNFNWIAALCVILAFSLLISCGAVASSGGASLEENLTSAEISSGAESVNVPALDLTFGDCTEQLWLDKGFTQEVQIETRTYYINSEKIPAKAAEKYISENEYAIANLNGFLQSCGYPVDSYIYTRFALDDYSRTTIGEYEIYPAGVLEGTSRYTQDYLGLKFRASQLKWCDVAVQSALLEASEPFEEQLIKQEEIYDVQSLLDDTGNNKFLAFDDIFFYGYGIEAEKAKILAADFGKYLLEQFGIGRLLSLYEDPMYFQEICGVTLNSARNAWLFQYGARAESIAELKPRELKYIPTEEEKAALETALTVRDGWVFYATEDCEYYFEPNYLGSEEIWNFVRLNETGREKLREFFPEAYLDYDGLISYFISGGSSPSSAGAEKKVILYRVKEQAAEYVHETSHIMAGRPDELWIEEGFATYVDWLYSEFESPPHYGKDLDLLAYKIIFEDAKTYMLSMGENVMRGESRIEAYAIAGSLVKYIDETYGRETLFEIYLQARHPENVVGLNFDKLVQKWTEKLKTTFGQ
jgi:hypothetical protein